ncbi:MAG: protein kinase [Planctomycetota bacterium]
MSESGAGPTTPVGIAESPGFTRHERSPAYISLCQLISRLGDPTFSSIRPVGLVLMLDTHQLLQRIDEEANSLLNTARTELEAKVLVLGQEEALRDVCRDLHEIIEQLNGQARQPWTVSELGEKTAAWVDRFPRFLEDLERAELQHRAAAQFLDCLDQINLQMLSQPMAPFRVEWQGCAEAARRHISSGDVTTAEEALLPVAGRWSSIEPPLSAMARHYGVAAPGGLGDDLRTPGALAAQIALVVSWIEGGVARELTQNTQPEDLPDMPAGGAWLASPVVELALFLELQLVSRRAIVTHPARVIQQLADLSALCDSPPSAWMAEKDVQAVGTLLERSLSDAHSCGALAAAHDLVGEPGEPLLAAVVARTASNQLWRLPGDTETPAQLLLEKPFIKRALHGAKSDVSLATRLHVEVYGEEFASSDRSRIEAFSELAELGPLGAWLFVAYLDRLSLPADEALVRRFFSDPVTGDLRPDRACPLALLSQPQCEDPALRVLFAALELLYPPTLGVAYRAMWSAAVDRSDDFPQLRYRLESLAAHGAAGPELLSSGRGAEHEQLVAAERAAREHIHPFRYRNRRNLARVATEFQNEVAEPLLGAARTAQEPAECQSVLDMLEQERAAIEGGSLERKLQSFSHVDELGTAKVAEHCRRMLDGIRQYVELKKSSLGEHGFVISRKALDKELDEIATWGWAARQAAKLLRVLLVEHQPVLSATAFPGNTTTLHPDAWGFPRCVHTWRRGELGLAKYSEALEQDLRGPDPAHYAISCARQLDVEWGREALGHLRDVTPELLEQFEREKRDWQELIEQERLNLQEEIRQQNLSLSEEEQELWASIDEAIRQEAFLAADEAIGELKRSLADPARTSAQRVATMRRIREETEVFLSEISAARECFTKRSAWFEGVSRIVDFSRSLPQETAQAVALSDTEVARLAEAWDSLRAQIGARMQSSPAPTAAPSPVAPPPEVPSGTTAVAVSPLEPQTARRHAGTCFGVVKKLAVDQSRGFITAFDHELLQQPGDIYFERSSYTGSLNEVSVGSLVELAEVSRAPNRGQMQARKVHPVAQSRRSEASQQLQTLVTHYEDGIGVVIRSGPDRKVLNELLGCLPEAPGSAAIDVGTIVRFEMVPRSGEGPLARILGPADPSEVGEVRKTLLKKIAYSPPAARPPVPVAAFIGNVFQTRWLSELSPYHIDAVRAIRLLRDKVARSKWHFEVVNAVRHMLADAAPLAVWLEAVFVDSFVRVFRAEGRSAQEILSELTSQVPRWWQGNVDAMAHDLYSCLAGLVDPPSLETAKTAAGTLGWSVVYEFFSNVQRNLGSTPHFRLELIMARIMQAQLEFSSDLNLLRGALEHVERSLVLNPRQTEAVDLRRALEAEWEEREAGAYKPKTAPSVREWDSLPEDPIERVAHIQGFYQKPDLSPQVADKQFDAWRQQVEGAALEELALLHSRLLTNWGMPERAHDLLMQQALAGSVNDWSRTLSALFEVWRRMSLPLDRIREQTLALEKRVPKDEQYRLYLLLARSAEDHSRLEEARRYAELARGGRAVAAEADLMLRRLGQAEEPESDSARLRETIWNQICAAVAEGTSRVDLLIAPYLSEPQVGPVLAKHAVLERQAFDLQPSGRAELCRRLSERLTDSTSVDLFLASAEVRGETFAGHAHDESIVGVCSRIEALVEPRLLEELLAHPPSRDCLAGVHEHFGPGDEWRSLAFFETLASFRPQNLLVVHFLGLAAKRAAAAAHTTPKGRRTAQQIFFECAIRSLDGVPGATAGWPAKQFTDWKWHGLALAVAIMSPTSLSEELPLSRLLANARPTDWAWPNLMYQARVDQHTDWVNAANSAICALLGAPDHWACCETFFDVFRESGRNKELARQYLELGLSIVNHLLVERPTPELRVLKAQLLEELVGLDPRRTWDEVRREIEDLCRQAHQQAEGAFEPAAQIQARLEEEEREEPRYREGMRILGRYDIIYPVGRGSFGQLYKAKLIEDGRIVALKQLNRTSVPSEMEERRRMLRQEAEFLRHLTDRHVPQFIGYSDEPPTLAMEWIEGDTVFHLRSRALTYTDWRTVAVLARQLVGALHSAYALANRLHAGYEFAHRDIHAANVMLVKPKERGGQPEAKLLDFGLARLPKSLLTSEAKKVATPDLPYRDPDWPSGGLHGDMFSLGVVLYDLLMAGHPYDEGKYREYRFQPKDSRDPRELAKYLKPLPKECAPLTPILERMVKPLPKDRFQDWDDLLRALNQLELPG